MIHKQASRLMVLVFVLLALNALAGCGPFPGGAREEDVASIAGGSLDNLVADYATVCGGSGNIASAVHATVCGGSQNTATVQFSVIGGGVRNTASAVRSTVGGGYNNRATKFDATIGGGGGNAASGSHTTVGGGSQNTANGYGATIGGGFQNTASGTNATVSGGTENVAGGFDATIGGGAGNTAKGTHAAVSGGLGNEATGMYAALGGGYANTTDGAYTTIPGGFQNQAAGDYSFAAGRRSTVDAAHDGAFLFADAHDFEFSSAAANEFAVRATGGVRLATAIDGNGTPVAGVTLAPGSGSWSSLSAREAKENISRADAYLILKRLSELPISTWNYAGQDPSIRHAGPMAQDFYDAFGVGEDAKHITTVDADGIALAAIQGLYRLVQEKDAQIATQQKTLTALEARVATLEQAGGADSLPTGTQSLGMPPAWLLFGGVLLAGVVLRRRV
jgi:hypothetical protein